MIDAGKHPTGMWPQRLVRPYVEPYGIPPYIVWYHKVKGKRELFNSRLNNDIVWALLIKLIRSGAKFYTLNLRYNVQQL